jgi:hypothetical protein
VKAQRAWTCTAVGVALLLSAVPLVAHHSFAAEFDVNRPITLKGTISRMEWVNPHGWLYIDVTGADGKVVNWGLEFGAPTSLYRRGWRKDSLPIGMMVTVTGYQAKDGSMKANARHVVLPDGKRLFAGSSGTGAPDDPKPK